MNINEIVRAITALSRDDQELLAGILVARINGFGDDAGRLPRLPDGDKESMAGLVASLQSVTDHVSSPEIAEAIERASLAVMLIAALRLWPLFDQWCRARKEELSGEERERLQTLGLDPDA